LFLTALVRALSLRTSLTCWAVRKHRPFSCGVYRLAVLALAPFPGCTVQVP